MMTLTKTQRGVAAGMAVGLGATLLVLVLASTIGSSHLRQDNLADRLALLSFAVLLPCMSLAIAVARLAKHRFFTPEDIDGSALSAGTDRARLLQSLLQNTLEQIVLALPVYLAWAVLAPGTLLPVLPAAACLFLLGRLLFFRGYAHGAAARALGFALTFYPTLALLFGLGWMALRAVVG